jgi:uncharacterized iron-regulated protein
MRHLIIGLPLCAALLACVSAGSGPGPYRFETRLTGDAVVLLGEVHDNAVQHRLRLAVLRRALAAGWRPAIVMEQFDIERQADIDRARREQPDDPQHLIDLAAPAPGGGWSWDLYRPVVALALEYHLPLIAGNLSRSDASRVVSQGFGAVFDPARTRALKLDEPIPSLQAAQEREIDAGHCHALPPSLLPGMARAQLARDAVMAQAVALHAAQGVVLLAGDGHVRRDLGVPRWLGDPLAWRLLAVGFLEQGDTAPRGAYDAVVYAERAFREDPCESLLHRKS